MIKIIRQNYKKNIRIFSKERAKLLLALGNEIFIEHIGSTAIPKMSGKNIIDIAVAVKDLSDIEKVAEQINKLNFYRGINNHSGEYIFFASRKEETRNGNIHLHLVMKDSDRFNDFIAIKQYLLNNPQAITEYTSVKYKVARLSLQERGQYKTIKSEYMNKILAKSKEYNATNTNI